MKKKIIPWLFLIPSLSGVILFYAFPFVDVVKRSFMDAMGNQFMGMENYRTVLKNSSFHLAAGNTLRFTMVCIPLLLLISFAEALLISALTDRSNIFRTTLVLPMVIPAASMVLIWKILLCPEGVLNQWLTIISGRPWNTDWAFSSWAFPILTATYLWKHMGYDMILWLAGLAGIPHELYEAAQMDGAGTITKLWYITLPGLKGSFGLIGILSIVNSFRVYREAYLLAGTYPDSSIYLLPHLFAHWFLRLDIQKMTASAVMLTSLCIVPVLLFYLYKKCISAINHKITG